MPDTAARLALYARRYEVARFTIVVVGIDMRGVDMKMQARLFRGAPGAPLFSLATVTTAAAEGLKVDSVTVTDGVTTSIIKGRINQSTMSDFAKVPPANGVGAEQVLAYAMQWTIGGDAQTRLEGELIVRDSAFGSDNAPVKRALSSSDPATIGSTSGDTLTFGDQVVRVTVDGTEVVGVMAASAARDASSAQTSAAQASAAAAAVVPLGTATVTSNDASATVYAVTLPGGVNAGVNGQKFSFIVPATALGGTVRLNVSGQGLRDVFFAASRTLRAGWLATFSANNGGFRWNFESQLPNDLSLADTEIQTDATFATVSSITGAQIAKPFGGNPNEVFIPYAPLTDSLRFTALITASPTGPLFVTNGNGERRSVVNTSGAQVPAGVIVGPTIVSLQFSGGYGNFVYIGSTAIPTLPDLKALASAASPSIWKVLDAAVNAPYGAVAKGGNGQPVFTPTTINILGRGSSVATAADDAQGQPGRNGGCPRDHVPVFLLRDAINNVFGPGIKAVAWNYSKGGTVASQGASQWDEAVAAGMPAVPDIAFDCFGMNDLSPYSYNSGQISPTFLPGAYYDEIRGRLDAGVKLFIIATTPHENTDKYDYSLNGVPMIWPYNVASPVAPAQLVPPAAQSVVNRDWTGSGTKRNGSARAQHVNTMLRDVVRRFNADPVYRGRVVLCDAGWSWFRNGLEKYTLTQLYGPQEIVHPIELGHAVSYNPCIREIVDAMQRGQSDKWWFRGEDAGVILP